MCTLKDWAALVNAVCWPLIVALALLLFKTDLVGWVKGITNVEGWGFKFTLAEATRTTATALSSTATDFDRISPLLDWNKVGAEVRKWAARNDAPNPADMGPENFRRFLFDIGLPGGQPTDLKWVGEGANRKLVYQ
jgi:hypothetical protein